MRKQSTPFLRIRTIAVTEIIIAIVGLLLIDLFFGHGDRFAGVSPHPFWFLVILISAQYGVLEGCLAALVASVAYLVGNVRPQGANEYIYSYLLDVGTQPLLWLVTAFVLGSIRFRHIVERDRLRRHLAESYQREDMIAANYEQLRGVKETLEQRLVKQFHTAVDVFKAAQAMETRDPAEILAGLQELIRVLLSPRKFSVFMLGDEGLAATIRYAWSAPDEFLPLIPSTQRLYEEVIGQKRLVCITNAKDEVILARQGMLAGPIISDNGQILGMLKIEDIGYSELHITTLETFRIVCSWIGNAYYQAEEYQKASGASLIDPQSNLYSDTFFTLQTQYLTRLAQRFDFNATLLTLTLLFDGNVDKERHLATVACLKSAAEQRLRASDQLFTYQSEQNTYRILLPGSTCDDIQLIMRKILDVFEQAQREAGTKLKISLATQALHSRKQRFHGV